MYSPQNPTQLPDTLLKQIKDDASGALLKSLFEQLDQAQRDTASSTAQQANGRQAAALSSVFEGARQVLQACGPKRV